MFCPLKYDPVRATAINFISSKSPRDSEVDDAKSEALEEAVGKVTETRAAQ